MSAQLVFLREELQELNEAIAATEEVAQEEADSFAWGLSLNSLRARRKELLAEIRTELADARVAELNLRFDGEPIQGDTVEAGFFGESLGCLQKLVFALGQALAARPTARGSIPESVMEQTRLRLASVRAGSFTVALVGKAQPNLFGESLIQDTFESLHSLIQVGDNAEGLADLLSGLGGRVQGHYAAFLSTLTSANASAELQTWRDATTPRLVTVSAVHARNIADALSLLQREEERTQRLSGRLIGLLQHKAQFEFQEPDTREVIAGKVLPDALRKAVQYFDQDIIADFSVETIGVEGREEVKQHWTLADLDPQSTD